MPSKQEMIEKYPDEFLNQVAQFLADFAEYTEETEPYATATIKTFKDAYMHIPASFEDL